MTRDEAREFANSDEFTSTEKDVVLHVQYGVLPMGSFFTSLWKAIVAADLSNLRALEKGFPEEVKAWRSWTRGDLATRVESWQLKRAGVAGP